MECASEAIKYEFVIDSVRAAIVVKIVIGNEKLSIIFNIGLKFMRAVGACFRKLFLMYDSHARGVFGVRKFLDIYAFRKCLFWN